MLRETLRLQESDMSPGLVMGETTRLCTQGPRAGQVRSNEWVADRNEKESEGSHAENNGSVESLPPSQL